MALSKNASILITLFITLTATVTITVEAARQGLLDFVGIGPEDDVSQTLINGTIINSDNKTYGILIVPKNLTVPGAEPAPVPEPNKPPHIEVSDPINSTLGKPVEIYAEVTDEDGNVTAIEWNQEGGEIVDYKVNGSRINFTPKEVDTYKFSIKATDDDNATTLRTVTLIVAKEGVPVPVPAPTPQPAPTPVPAPTPAPPITQIKYIAVGDVQDTDSGIKVWNAIKAEKPQLLSLLGDLGYDDDATWLKSTYGTLGNAVFCQIGNHDDGISDLERYCGTNSYYTKKGPFLIFGINTDGDLVKQGNEIVTLLKNTQFMAGITDVFFNSHKFYKTPPHDHHTVETDVKAMYDKINAAIPATVKDEYYVAAHNHFMAHGVVNGDDYFISGAGGRGHYGCSTNTQWTFCNDSSYGYLEFTLKQDGSVTAQFQDYNGRVLNN